MSAEFIKNAEGRINSILSELGWTWDETLKVDEKRSPKSNPTPQADSSDDEDIRKSLQDPPLPASLVEGPSTIKLTPQLMEEIFQRAIDKEPTFIRGPTARETPQTANQYLQTFTRDERRALHDYVIANTYRPLLPEIDDLMPMSSKAGDNKERSAIELAIAERDAKRRRATYRNKVHTNRKTHIEVMREVIENQMVAFYGESVIQGAISDSGQGSKEGPRSVEKRRSVSDHRERERSESYRDFKNYSYEETSRKHRNEREHDDRRHEDRRGYATRDTASSSKDCKYAERGHRKRDYDKDGTSSSREYKHAEEKQRYKERLDPRGSKDDDARERDRHRKDHEKDRGDRSSRDRSMKRDKEPKIQSSDLDEHTRERKKKHKHQKRRRSRRSGSNE